MSEKSSFIQNQSTGFYSFYKCGLIQIKILDQLVMNTEPFYVLPHIIHIHILKQKIEVCVDHQFVHFELPEAGQALDHVGQEFVIDCEPLILQPNNGVAERDLD